MQFFCCLKTKKYNLNSKSDLLDLIVNETTKIHTDSKISAKNKQKLTVLLQSGLDAIEQDIGISHNVMTNLCLVFGHQIMPELQKINDVCNPEIEGNLKSIL